MENKSAPWSILLILSVLLSITIAEDSLRSALNAVNRRQRDLSDLSKYGDYYNDGYEDNDEIDFINPSDSRNADLERNLLEYIEENGMPELNRDDFTKRISSSFRERVEEDRERQRKKLAEYLIYKLENDKEIQENEEYDELLRELWNKYRRLYDPSKMYEDDRKKKSYSDYYPSLGWDSVGMRKRSRYFEPDGPSESLYLLNYTPREEYYNKFQDENDNDDYYNSNLNKFTRRDRKYDVNLHLPYMTRKRFPVTKRSSNYYMSGVAHQRDEKRSTTKKEMALKTDPKVAEELSNIFTAPKEKSSTEKSKKSVKKVEHTTEKPKKSPNNSTTTENPTKVKTFNKKKQNVKNSKENKEVTENLSKDKPLQIKKKSINWSDYFGLDKRKKKSDNGLDNEWLMERYHKAIAMATKRNDHSSENHQHEMKKDSNYEDNKNTKNEEVKINDMETKLKNIEDSIIDEALKFTGAHQGIEDTKEIQEVKDKVMTRLAAAYNLEKMRKALEEYRLSIEKEKDNIGKTDIDDYLLESKRVSVPRKQAIDEDREKNKESDNNIKCTENDEECDEQNYKVPSELIDRPEWDKEQCPKVQRACNEVASVLGHHGRVFEAACNIHQICLLCGENSWFAPTRRCNILFLSKANELCEDDMECQNVARRSVRYLLDINRTLRTEALGDCDLVCPENR